MAKPLTTLLKKDSFLWTTEAEQAFKQLKIAMVSPPVLALLNFDVPFIIKTNASGWNWCSPYTAGLPYCFH